MQTLPWLVALTVLVVLGIGLAAWGAQPRRHRKSAPLPSEWRIAPRLVFSTAERRIYRLLREALPNHVLLSKLPLVRFCQPIESSEKNYWYNLLGTSHVTFAVCVPNGRVVAAIDVATDHPHPRRVLQIKQSVLDACRVRYLRFSAERLPTLAELQVLVPRSSADGAPAATTPAATAPAADLDQARDTLASTVAIRRAERNAQWHESTLFQDSFFAPDSRLDGYAASEFLPSTLPEPGPGEGEVAGVVVDSPPLKPAPAARVHPQPH